MLSETDVIFGNGGVYTSFFPDFSFAVSPLKDHLKSGAKFVWSSACQNAFDNVKMLLRLAPVLAALWLEKTFHIQVDTSHVGRGGTFAD